MWIAGAALGVGAAFIVGPLVAWLLGLAGDAPAPLRLAAGLPFTWALPTLTLVGLGVGIWFGREWQKENGTITIAPDGLTVRRSGDSTHIARSRIGGVYTDRRELVVVDDRTNELRRFEIDRLLTTRLRDAFERFEYPWQGTADPHDHSFADWIDGTELLSARANDLLRTRRRALIDKRHGAAEQARDELSTLGIAVRDRHDLQQYRVVPRSE